MTTAQADSKAKALYGAAPVMYAFIEKNIVWLRNLIEQMDAREKASRGRFDSLANACALDAKNFRVQLEEAESIIARAEGRSK